MAGGVGEAYKRGAKEVIALEIRKFSFLYKTKENFKRLS
jgi:hypothetical protein